MTTKVERSIITEEKRNKGCLIVMSSCNGNCSSCSSADCGDRKKESLLAALNPKASVKKVNAVVSGKGGVG